MFAYKRSNLKFPAAIYVRSDGKVSFAAFGNTTTWHGLWSELGDGRSVVQFHGDVDRMSGVTLIKEGDGNWIGIEESKAITFLKLKFECHHCDHCRCWHRTSGGLEVVV